MTAPAKPQVVEADRTWTGMGFEAGIQVVVGAGGRIEAVGRLGRPVTRRLAGQALVPGFVNAHSHAFQRGLRARVERFVPPTAAGARPGPAGEATFWTWRDGMYRLAETLDPEAFLRLSVGAFEEMRDAGITTVGEFHYLHHSRAAHDYAYDDLVLAAARQAGIRLVLLEAYYAQGGAGRELAGAQQRFETRSPAEYWAQVDRLRARCDPATQTLGAAVHSVRAADPEAIAALYREARRRGLVFHMHVEEQPREVEECVAAYGLRPMRFLIERLGIGGGDAAHPDGAGREGEGCRFTAVHCTHTRPDDLAAFLAGGGGACLCPLTEANLGDGIPDLGPLASLRGAGVRLCLGTDSNARIGMLEEMRWLEYGQRLRTGRRGVLAGEDGRVGPALLRAATEGGAWALGVEAGRIEPGLWADFAALDLGHPALAGAGDEALAEALAFAADNGVVAATCVAGAWRPSRGRFEEPPRTGAAPDRRAAGK